MDVTMSQNSRTEYLQKMRCRYAGRTGKQGKTMLIDEFCEVTGHERKYAIKLLGCRRCDPNAPPQKTGRKPAYGGEAKAMQQRGILVCSAAGGATVLLRIVGSGDVSRDPKSRPRTD